VQCENVGFARATYRISAPKLNIALSLVARELTVSHKEIGDTGIERLKRELGFERSKRLP